MHKFAVNIPFCKNKNVFLENFSPFSEKLKSIDMLNPEKIMSKEDFHKKFKFRGADFFDGKKSRQTF